MRTFALAAFALSLLATPALADMKEDAVAARQGHFKLYGANVGALAAMAKGEVEYNAQTAQMHADNLALLTQTNIGFLFVPGTSAADMPGKTRARATIWEDFPGVGAAAANLAKAAANLKIDAGGGRAALGAALGQVGGACKECHQSFRIK